MSEAELVSAVRDCIAMSYAAAQWWITVTTALVVATYFAAERIPWWLLGVIVALYLLTAVSATWEMGVYSEWGYYYGARLTELRTATHVSHMPSEGPVAIKVTNTVANYFVLAIGTFVAIAYSWLTWRAARSGLEE